MKHSQRAEENLPLAVNRPDGFRLAHSSTRAIYSARSQLHINSNFYVTREYPAAS